MNIFSPVPRKRGRIEIIPLIDIMFFLLAAFMMVSIHKIKVKSLKVSLPTDVPVAQLEPKEDFVTVSVNAQGQVQIDKDLITDPTTLLPKLQAIYTKNKDQKILISADKDSRNGDVIAVLAKLRTAGFQRVGFNLKGGGAPPPGTAAPDASAPPATPPAPAAGAPAAPAPPGAPAAPASPAAPSAVPAPPAPPAPPAAETSPSAPPPAAPAAPPAPPEAPAPPTAPAPAKP